MLMSQDLQRARWTMAKKRARKLFVLLDENGDQLLDECDLEQAAEAFEQEGVDSDVINQLLQQRSADMSTFVAFMAPDGNLQTRQRLNAMCEAAEKLRERQVQRAMSSLPAVGAAQVTWCRRRAMLTITCFALAR